MRSFRQFVPEHIRRLAQSRSPTEAASEHTTSEIRLHLNENPFGPSPLALAAMREALAYLHRYPEPDAARLEREIARFHAVEPGAVLVTAGITELLGLLTRALLGPGRNALTSARSFLVYRLATAASGGNLTEVAARDHGYDLTAIAQAIDENTRIIFLANPNNPTGTLIPAATLTAFLDDLPHHLLLVIDEAYFDFANYFARRRGIEYSRSLDYVRQ
jgi:histidinol-phosphate aminotransferase